MLFRLLHRNSKEVPHGPMEKKQVLNVHDFVTCSDMLIMEFMYYWYE
jgi:hypothetical protein